VRLVSRLREAAQGLRADAAAAAADGKAAKAQREREVREDIERALGAPPSDAQAGTGSDQG
jgi:hypothetical protein